MKFEYKSMIHKNMTEMDELGQEGWELVNIFYDPNARNGEPEMNIGRGQCIAFFKRKIDDEQ